jgi:hypothetical protein
MLQNSDYNSVPTLFTDKANIGIKPRIRNYTENRPKNQYHLGN